MTQETELLIYVLGALGIGQIGLQITLLVRVAGIAVQTQHNTREINHLRGIQS